MLHLARTIDWLSDTVGRRLGIALVVGVLMAITGCDSQTSQAPETSRATNTQTEISFSQAEDGGPLEGPARVVVEQGSRITLRVTLRDADELHVHGYDLHQNVEPGAPAVLEWVADKAGRFEVELHDSERGLTVIEVHPR